MDPYSWPPVCSFTSLHIVKAVTESHGRVHCTPGIVNRLSTFLLLPVQVVQRKRK